MLPADKAVYEQVVYDSDPERTFADQLEKNGVIKVYAKLPGWFEVQTPLGKYNPDWAVLMQQDGEERLYFVVETKSGLFADDLRDKERAKIKCGEAHFEALAVGTGTVRRGADGRRRVERSSCGVKHLHVLRIDGIWIAMLLMLSWRTVPGNVPTRRFTRRQSNCAPSPPVS